MSSTQGSQARRRRLMAATPFVMVRNPHRCGVRAQRRELPVGDYAVLDGDRCVAAVERKTVAKLAPGATAAATQLACPDAEAEGQAPRTEVNPSHGG
jgi:hypothetical protein